MDLLYRKFTNDLCLASASTPIDAPQCACELLIAESVFPPFVEEKQSGSMSSIVAVIRTVQGLIGAVVQFCEHERDLVSRFEGVDAETKNDQQE